MSMIGSLKRAVASFVMLAWCGAASAFSIGLSPASASHVVGSPFSLDVVVQGLASDNEILSTYDIDIAFQPGIGYVSAGSSGKLGASMFFDTPGSGSVNLFELSFELDGDLVALQGGAFTVATLTFIGNALGSFDFMLTANALGGSQVADPNNPPFTIARDLLGDLGPTLTGATVVIADRGNPIPAPGTALLAALGLLALLGGGAGRPERSAC